LAEAIFGFYLNYYAVPAFLEIQPLFTYINQRWNSLVRTRIEKGVRGEGKEKGERRKERRKEKGERKGEEKGDR
jgi:hypothetical protein